MRLRASATHQTRPPSAATESWQHEFLSHAPEYCAEFAGSCFLLFCVVGTVAFMFAPHGPASRAIPSPPARLFITGLILGGAGSLVAITPVGRLSGAHLNPAVSLTFFAEGKMKLHDLAAYTVAQALGGLLGAWIGVAAFPQAAAAVRDAITQPGPHVSAGWAAAAEFACVFILTSVILWMLSRHPLMPWTPLGAVVVVAVAVWLDGSFSGASLNPARSFGPALLAGKWTAFWVYLVGPCAGGALAGALRRLISFEHSLSGKIFHDRHYRSIFAGEADHAANAHLRQHCGQPENARPPLHRSPTRELGGPRGEKRAA